MTPTGVNAPPPPTSPPQWGGGGGTTSFFWRLNPKKIIILYIYLNLFIFFYLFIYLFIIFILQNRFFPPYSRPPPRPPQHCIPRGGGPQARLQTVYLSTDCPLFSLVQMSSD